MAERAKFAQLENLRRRRPPSWISQNVNVSGLDEDICIKFGVKIYYGHEEMTHEREVETGSWFAWRHQMNVSKKWRRFQGLQELFNEIWYRELQRRTINTTERAKFT